MLKPELIWLINMIIVPLSDIPMFYIKYLTMYKVRMHAGAIITLLCGCAYVREIIHSLKIIFPYIRTNHRILYTKGTYIGCTEHV